MISKNSIKDKEIVRTIEYLNYGKERARQELNKLSLSDFSDLDDYNNRYIYLRDLISRINCELEDMENWIRIMSSETKVMDFLK